MKIKLLLLITLILFIPFMVKAKELKIDFENNFGGNSYDEYTSVKQT